MDLRYARSRRISRKTDITRLLAHGRRAGDNVLTLLALPNDLPFCRAAVAVSRRHGHAVRRNRAKRLCREAFRLSQPQLPGGWDYLLMPRAGPELALRKLQDSLVRLAGRATGQRGEAPT
jgi:ribonuclease P protein component